jgi:tetratricopeptide (TPR) repeat protein
VRRHPFFVFLAAAFAAKLIVVLQLQDHALLQPEAGIETAVYAQLARQIVAGNWSLGPGLYLVSPLYIYFLAAIVAVTDSFTAVRVVQVLLGTAAIGCSFVAAREWFGRRAAWFAAILAAMTGLFTFYEVLLLPSALDPFLTAAGLAALALAFSRASQLASRASSAWFVAAGVAFGAQTLNRPNVLVPALVIVVLLAVYHLRIRADVNAGGRLRRLNAALSMAAGLAIALGPVMVRNISVAGYWSPVSSPAGVNFYIGNNAEADGTYHNVPGITTDIQGQQEDARRVAEQNTGRKLDDGEVSAYFYGLGWSWIRLHPGDAARLFARKLLYIFCASHISPTYSYPFYAYDAKTLLGFLVAGPWLLLPLGLVGLALGIAHSRARRTEYLIWASFVPVYAVSLAIFFVTERFRVPLLVPLCVGAGAALDYALDAIEYRRFRVRVEAAGLVALIVLAWLTNRPMRADDGRAEERTRMAEAMVAAERFDEAEYWVTEAERIHRHPGLLHFRVGRLLLAHNKPGTALNHFQRARQIDPSVPVADYAIGQALMDANRPKEAIPHLEAALRAGVQADLAGFDLARARAAIGDRAGALQVLQSVKPENPDDSQAWTMLGEFARQLDAASLAAAFFGQAVRLEPRAPKIRQDLGHALATMGRYPEAIVQFEQAVALDSSDPAAHLNLAVAYAEAGRKADARKQAQEALRLKPDYNQARQFLAKLR